MYLQNSVRWKELWVKNGNVDIEDSSYKQEEEDLDKYGLGTKLRPKSKGSYKCCGEFKNFLSQLQRELLSVSWVNQMSSISKNNWCIGEILNKFGVLWSSNHSH